MNRIFGKILSLPLLPVLCAGILAVGAAWPVPVSAADADYYAPITATAGEELLGQLHDLITTTHTRYTSYDDCKNPEYVKRTDPGPNGQLMEFYAQAELSSAWKSGANGTWNREHVWCKSLSNGLWGESGGGSDLLHIRPTESRLNNSRGNNKYGEVKSGKEAWYRDESGNNVALGGYVGGGVFEPLDNVKGDAARIVLYVYAHYNTYANVHGSTNGNGASYYFGTLNLTNVIAANSEEAAAELLLSWNELDPVDELELARNEAAFEIQGNRNPFVDHPEYAEAIWGDAKTGGEEELAQFHSAVSELKESGTLKERLAAINGAIRAYQALTGQERSLAAEDVAKLQAAVAAYNEAVRAHNAEAATAEETALGAVGGAGS